MVTKPFLGTPTPCPPDGNMSNALPLQVAKLSPATEEAFAQAVNTVQPLVNQAKPGCLAGGLSSVLSMIMMICLIAAVPLVFTGGFMVLLEVGSVVLMCFLVVKLLEKNQARKEKKVTESPEYQAAQARLAQIRRTMDAELGVPANCMEVDILRFDYQVQEGQIVPFGTRGGYAAFKNPQVRVFSDGNTLYIASLKSKFAFDLSALTGFRTVHTPISISEWNKELSYTEDYFKQRGVASLDEEPGYKTDGYCVLTFEMDDTRWELYIPNYEMAVFENLVRRIAQ